MRQRSLGTSLAAYSAALCNSKRGILLRAPVSYVNVPVQMQTISVFGLAVQYTMPQSSWWHALPCST